MWQLRINGRATGIAVQPADRHPGMWRINGHGRTSDLVNLSRAKDAAIMWARPRGLGGLEVASWHLRELASEAPPAGSSGRAGVRAAERLPGSPPIAARANGGAA